MGMDSDTITAAGPRTFHTFVTGAPNALAYNAALTVARTPGAAHNPLHLCGAPGNGKTHLLRAIAAYLAPRLAGAEIILTGADAFAREAAAQVRGGYGPAFRRRYRRAGALLIDDVSAIAGSGAEDELARVIDALREANRQVVTADEHRPGLMRGVRADLHARLGSTIATLGAPDEEMRLAILRRARARDEALTVPDEALTALAARLRGSVRDVEDALASLLAEALAYGDGASPLLARQVAADINRANRRPHGQALVEPVLAAVCDYYALSRDLLLSKDRSLTVAHARQVTMYLLREDAGLTAVQTGQRLGRDHSTVLSGHAKIADALLAGDAVTTAILAAVRALVRERRAECA